MMRTWFVAVASLTAFDSPAANDGILFATDRYFFELSYGQGMEFYQEEHLPGSPIWKLSFKSILRIELPPPGAAYRGFVMPQYTATARLLWNPSRTLVAAAFREHTIVFTPQFHMLAAYRNIYPTVWRSDDELLAIVETGGPVSRYQTAQFALNVRTERSWRVAEP